MRLRRRRHGEPALLRLRLRHLHLRRAALRAFRARVPSLVACRSAACAGFAGLDPGGHLGAAGRARLRLPWPVVLASLLVNSAAAAAAPAFGSPRLPPPPLPSLLPSALSPVPPPAPPPAHGVTPSPPLAGAARGGGARTRRHTQSPLWPPKQRMCLSPWAPGSSSTCMI